MTSLGLADQQGLQLAKPPVPLKMNDKELNAWVDQIVGKNTKLNFIDRVARPELYPTLPTNDGGMMTHKMAWGDLDGKPIVFPTVVFDPSSMGLKELGMDEAFQHAIKTKEYLPFQNEDQADLFSREYKRHWRDGKGPEGYASESR